MQSVYYSFSDIVRDITSMFNKIKQSDYLIEGSIPIVDQSKNLIGGYTNARELLVHYPEPVVIFGDHTKIVKYLDFDAVLGADGAKVLASKDINLCYPKYLFYFIKSIKFPELNYSRHFKFLKDVKIPLPDLETQKHIAQILTEVEQLIQAREQSLVLLDKLAKSIFVDMFGDPVLNNKKWKIAKLGEVAKIENQSVEPSYFSQYANYIGLEHIEKNTGKILMDNQNLSNLKSTKFKFTSKHILYGKLRPNLNKVATPSFDGICSTDIFTILPIDKYVNKQFVAYFMRQQYFVNMMRSITVGTNLPRANKSFVNAVWIYIPPLDLQNKFATIIDDLEDLRSRKEQSLEASRRLYNALMQDAFGGELMASIKLNEMRPYARQMMSMVQSYLEKFQHQVQALSLLLPVLAQELSAEQYKEIKPIIKFFEKLLRSSNSTLALERLMMTEDDEISDEARVFLSYIAAQGYPIDIPTIVNTDGSDLERVNILEGVLKFFGLDTNAIKNEQISNVVFPQVDFNANLSAINSDLKQKIKNMLYKMPKLSEQHYFRFFDKEDKKTVWSMLKKEYTEEIASLSFYEMAKKVVFALLDEQKMKQTYMKQTKSIHLNFTDNETIEPEIE